MLCIGLQWAMAFLSLERVFDPLRDIFTYSPDLMDTDEHLTLDGCKNLIFLAVEEQWIKKGDFNNGLPWPLTRLHSNIRNAMETAKNNGIEDDLVREIFAAAVETCQ